MTDEDLMVIERLRVRVAAGEPSTPLHAAAVLDQGRRKLRRRRAATISAAAIAVAAVAVGGALTAGTTHDARPPVPPVDHTEFDPEVLTARIDKDVHAAGAPWTLQKLEVQADGPRPLRGPDRAAGHLWTASYSAGDDHVLQLFILYETPYDEAGVRDDCARDARYEDRCEVLASTSTSVTQLAEASVYDYQRMFVIMQDGVAPNLGPVPVKDRWYQRKVADYRTNGQIVWVREIVHAPTAAEAEPMWLESTDSLTAIATDPDLWTPPYPGALQQGDHPTATASLTTDGSASADVGPDASQPSCDPGGGFPKPKDGCPDQTPETGWLTLSRDGALLIEPFQTFTNDATGQAYAASHHLDFPFANDYYDASIGSPEPLNPDADTVCTGIIRVGYEEPLKDHTVGCEEFISALERGPIPVAVWRQGDRIAQLSELYRP